VAIRDGMEEYEVLRAAGETCKGIANAAGYTDFDINTTFSKLYQALYEGTKVIGDANSFATARELLSNFALFAKKGTIVTDVVNKSFSTLVKVFVSDGTLMIDGKEADYELKADGKEYTVEIQQTETANYLNFTLDQNGEKSVFKMLVGGKKQALKLSDLSFSSNEKINEIDTVKNQDGSVTVAMGGVKLKDDGSHWDDERQRIYLSGDLLSKNLKKSQGVTAIIIEIENPGDAFDLLIRYTGTRKPDDVLDFIEQRVSANGTTIITIETAALAWDFGAVNELRFYLQYDDVYSEREITIKSIVVTL
jgi:hypothetical protein